MACKEISDLRLGKAEASRQLEQANGRIEALTLAKNRAESRLGGLEGHLKEAQKAVSDLQGELQRARNQIEYLEALLVFEERSGFLTLVSET